VLCEGKRVGRAALGETHSRKVVQFAADESIPDSEEQQ
jgi:hypothetical protein